MEKKDKLGNGHGAAYYSSGLSSPSTIDCSADENIAFPVPLYPGHAGVPECETCIPDDVPPTYNQTVMRDNDVSVELTENGRFSIFIDPSIIISEQEAPLALEESAVAAVQSLTCPDSEQPLLNIVIQAVGRRGDVQPLIFLGKELQNAGHNIRVATHSVFESSVKGAGLEFFPIGDSIEQSTPYMARNPEILPTLANLRSGGMLHKREMFFEMLEECWRSCIEPGPTTNRPFVAEAIIANPASFAHIHCAQALGVPVHLMSTMPSTPTRNFPHPLANITSHSWAKAESSNFLTYGLVDFITWQGLIDGVNVWRKSCLSLEPIRAMVGVGLAEYLHVPVTYLWSPSLVPKPPDWASNIDICGFLFPEPPDFIPPVELEKFLQAGPAPVYIGFGSTMVENKVQVTEIILSAVRRAGVRAVISRGRSQLGGDYLDHNVIFIDDCPHEWLFQHVSVVVHHGGAGTTACGLRHGRPTITIPFFGDQSFWGDRVSEAGVGPPPIDHKLINAANLAAAIRRCLELETQQAAKVIADCMLNEFGVRNAVRSFHRHLPTARMRCDLLPQKPAVWQYELNKTQLKLSDEAAFILMEQTYRSKPIEITEQRWDPLTAGSSSLLNTIAALTSGGKSMFVQPYKRLKKVPSSHGVDTAEFELRRDTNHAQSSAGAAAGAAGREFGKMMGSLAKGVLLDLPVAMADGFHAMPKLYGDKTMERGAVSNWKNGMTAGGKALVGGFYKGFTGIVTAPVKGAVQNGGVGFAKGFVTGTLGVVVKPGAAMLGFVGYPVLGAFKSISALHATPTESKILLARQIHGSDTARRLQLDERHAQKVVSAFRLAIDN